MTLSAMCGRLRVGKGFLHVCSSLGRCSHVFGLLARHTRPLAIMPSADQVPVNSTHSTMRWHKWVVLIAGSTGSALRAVCPFQPSHHAGWPTRSRLCRKRDGLPERWTEPMKRDDISLLGSFPFNRNFGT